MSKRNAFVILLLFVLIVLSGVAFGWELPMFLMIHDISTDTENPPDFEALLPLRVGARNPAGYPGKKVAALQKQAYPDLKPLKIAAPFSGVFQSALDTARELGWEVVSHDSGRGRIEAVATTHWLRFKDDVVVRLERQGDQVRVDMRSKSRVGRSDLGENARRIRRFLKALHKRIPGASSDQSKYMRGDSG